MGLTPAQQEAYDAIQSRLEEGITYTALRGYAGTGKSYLISRLAADLADQHEILLTAPTHKAAQVLREMGQERSRTDNLPVRTLHSALGLRLTPNDEGGYALSPTGEARLPSRGLVIADEASMIGTALWEYIQQTNPRLSWLFIGDPAQLPPVGESSSPALTQEGPLLTSVVRQAAENPIIRLATQIRQGNLSLKDLDTAYANGEGIGITGSLEQFAESAVRHFASEAFEDDPAACRILAYRNRRVQRYNQLIRRHLHGEDAPRFLKGEWIVATATWNGPSPGITLHNSEELKVEKASTGTVTGRGGQWKVWTLRAWSRHAERKKTLLVLHEEEKDRFEEELARRKEMALADPKGWEAYYEMKEQFARVDYAYAMTVHKCLPADTIIEAESGPRPIGEVEEGDKVQTGKNRLRLVTGAFQTGSRRVVETRTATGTVLRSSPEHRILTPTGFVAASHLSSGDRVRKLLSQEYCWDTIEAVKITDETAEMVDLEVEEDHSFIAEGLVVHNSQGSTLDTGYVDWRDLAFRSGGQQAPLLYVAVTRPAKRLALLV